MKTLLKVLIASAVFAYTPAALSAEWVRLSENDVGDKFFIDAASIQRNGPFVWFWEYREFPQPNNAILDVAVNQPLHGAVMRWSIDCTNKSQRLRKINAYTTNRQLIDKFDYGDKGMLQQARPGSSAAVIANYACDPQKAKQPSQPATVAKP
jgi:hypothetical protein